MVTFSTLTMLHILTDNHKTKALFQLFHFTGQYSEALRGESFAKVSGQFREKSQPHWNNLTSLESESTEGIAAASNGFLEMCTERRAANRPWPVVRACG